MSLEIAIRLLAGVLLLLGNAFFVSVEFALTRLRQYSEEEILNDKGLERAWEITEKLEIYLTGCQLGISSTSIVLGIVAEPAVTEVLRPVFSIFGVTGQALTSVSVVVGIVLINLIHKIWGEQAPTYLGVERPKQIARYFATPLYWWVKITYPFIWLGDGVARQTLRLFGVEMTRSWTQETEGEGKPLTPKGEIAEVLKSSNVPADRREEVVKALEIDEIPVQNIMIPREDIIYLVEEDSLEDNLKRMQVQKSRYPLFETDDGKFKGVVYASEMLSKIEHLRSGEIDIMDVCRPGTTVAPGLPVSQLIDQFQHEHQELALIVNDKQIQGLVTITDALEAIVGSAEDPMDVENDTR